MSRPQSDLVVVCIRLRRADIDRAKAIAASAGLGGYQTWVREQVSAAVRNGTDTVWKLKGAAALAIVRASDVNGARVVARAYGEALAAESKLPATPFVSWIASAEAALLPETLGVVAWAGVGLPIRPASTRRRRRRRGPSKHRQR